ncbi:ankyrin repeat domain-containing protein [Echinicola rosea]|nr:ankyrin repeat domain-containing protein [Echinicola rosea]
MKKTAKNFLFALMLSPVLAFGQHHEAPGPVDNSFLSRDFWSGKPSLQELKAEVAEGNDPIELNSSSFNGTVYAILNDQPLENIKYLVSLDGNGVNLLTHDGRTYIHWAAMKGDLELIKYLIDQGAKTDIVDDHGYSVMNFAANAGQSNPELYDYLLSHGSSLEETNHHGANALLLIVGSQEDFTMIDYFTSKGVDMSTTDEDGNGLFYYAAKTGNIKMMDLLIEKGVSYKAPNKIGGNAMIAASQGTRRGSNDLSVFKYLEDKGIEPNVTTADGTTPLHALAGRSKDIGLLNYFMDKGVDVNQADGEGNTPLMNASGRNDLAVIQLLVEKTDDINAQNQQGRSALTNAVAGNTPEVVEYLLQKGAEAGVEDNAGNTLAYYLFQSYSPRFKEGFQKKKDLLVAEGVDLKAPQAGGNTLFHLAVEENDLELIKMVHGWGFDVNQANDLGTTPLQTAAMKAKDESILKYLLAEGADSKVVTDFDETVYDLASENEVLSKNNVNINFLK